jgi:putative endonuclease
MIYVYVLMSQCDGMFYTGSTRDLKRRLVEHSEGKVISTADRRPLKLVYYEACANEKDAMAREKYLKTGMGKRFIKNRLKYFLEDL